MTTVTNKIWFAICLVVLIMAPHIAQAANDITVYKSPTCGCCTKWVEYLKANGFNVIVNETDNLADIKKKENVPGNLQSCHTAVINGYVIEGHVPVEDIKRLISAQPNARGIAVAGMPQGSPGMDMGAQSQPYKVMLFDDKGQQTVYATH